MDVDVKLEPEIVIAPQIPSFLLKLWKIVDDEDTDEFVTWGVEGLSFVIKNQVEFASQILPQYYKHNNLASFNRQLNLYGFRKVVNIENGTFNRYDDVLEFSHPYFKKNQPELLTFIKRKRKELANNFGETNSQTINKILEEIENLKTKQSFLDTHVNKVKKQNLSLWHEISGLRRKHQNLQQIVNKLIEFLIYVIQSQRFNTNSSREVYRPFPLMIKSGKNLKNNQNYEIDSKTFLNAPEPNFQQKPLTIHEINENDLENLVNPSVEIQSPASFDQTEPTPSTSATLFSPNPSTAQDPGVLSDSEYFEENSPGSPEETDNAISMLERLKQLLPVANNQNTVHIREETPSPTPTIKNSMIDNSVKAIIYNPNLLNSTNDKINLNTINLVRKKDTSEENPNNSNPTYQNSNQVENKNVENNLKSTNNKMIVTIPNLLNFRNMLPQNSTVDPRTSKYESVSALNNKTNKPKRFIQVNIDNIKPFNNSESLNLNNKSKIRIITNQGPKLLNLNDNNLSQVLLKNIKIIKNKNLQNAENQLNTENNISTTETTNIDASEVKTNESSTSLNDRFFNQKQKLSTVNILSDVKSNTQNEDNKSIASKPRGKRGRPPAKKNNIDESKDMKKQKLNEGSIFDSSNANIISIVNSKESSQPTNISNNTNTEVANKTNDLLLQGTFGQKDIWSNKASDQSTSTSLVAKKDMNNSILDLDFSKLLDFDVSLLSPLPNSSHPSPANLFQENNLIENLTQNQSDLSLVTQNVQSASDAEEIDKQIKLIQNQLDSLKSMIAQESYNINPECEDLLESYENFMTNPNDLRSSNNDSLKNSDSLNSEQNKLGNLSDIPNDLLDFSVLEDMN